MTGTAVTARVVGTLRRLEDGRGAVRVEDVYETDVEDLWSALTDPRRLSRWVAEVSGELRLGGRIDARFTSWWKGPGRIDICEPPHRLGSSCPRHARGDRHRRQPGPRTWGTRLVVEERGIPLDELADHGAGWHAYIEDLAAHLDGRQPGNWRTRWTALRPTYRGLASGLR